MIVLMGVSGTGKSSLGKILSLQTGWPLRKIHLQKLIHYDNQFSPNRIKYGSFAFAFCLNNLL